MAEPALTGMSHEVNAMRYAEWYRDRISKPFKAQECGIFGWDSAGNPVYKVHGYIPRAQPEVADGSLFADSYAAATPLEPVPEFVFVWGHQIGIEWVRTA